MTLYFIAFTRTPQVRARVCCAKYPFLFTVFNALIRVCEHYSFVSLPVGGADVGGINLGGVNLSDYHTSQTFTCVNGNQIEITGSHVPESDLCFKCLTDMNWFFVSTGRAANHFGVDWGSANTLGKTNEFEAPKHSGQSEAGSDEKCYDWSSIFPTPPNRQCHLDIQDLVGETGDAGQSASFLTSASYHYGNADGDIEVNGDSVDVQDVLSLLSGFGGGIEICEAQSMTIVDSVNLGKHQDTADSEDDFSARRIAVGFCWVIGLIVFLLCLLKTYGGACEQQNHISRPKVCIAEHALEARIAASSKSCRKGCRQSWAVARLRKILRNWRWDSGPVRQWRSNMILGGIFLFVLMFQPVAEGSALVSQAASVSKTADQRPNIDLSQLAQLDIDPVLLQFIGNVVAELKEVKNDNMALQNRTQVVETKNLALQNRTQVLEVENKAICAELDHEKKRVASLESALIQLANKTTADTWLLKDDVQNMSVRLDECEQDSFEQIMNRRRNQEQSSACGIDAVQNMLAVCCSSGPVGNGHRRVQADGCDSLPPTCSLKCSSQFISIFENCQGQPVLEQLPPGELAQWRGFLGQCQEVQQSAAALSVADAQPAMIFHCLVLDDAAQSQAKMFGQVTSPVLPHGPLQPIITPPPPPVSDGGAAQVQEFRRVCTRANLTICAPPCNRASDGFLLSILIGGRGTMMTCNQEDGIFSWQGQSALGSCIT
eukprot:SAG11_NODE_330_length_10677_cov_8.535117_5_plen_716_part_00